MRALQTVVEKFKALQEVMRRPGGTMPAAERLAQCQSLMDELTDAMLDLPEPQRAQFLKQLVPIRETIRALKVE